MIYVKTKFSLGAKYIIEFCASDATKLLNTCNGMVKRIEVYQDTNVISWYIFTYALDLGLKSMENVNAVLPA